MEFYSRTQFIFDALTKGDGHIHTPDVNLPELIGNHGVYFVCRPLPFPERSGSEFTVRSPVMFQSGAISPSPNAISWLILRTELILQIGLRSQFIEGRYLHVNGYPFDGQVARGRWG